MLSKVLIKCYCVYLLYSWWWGYFQTIYNVSYGTCHKLPGTGKMTFVLFVIVMLS